MMVGIKKSLCADQGNICCWLIIFDHTNDTPSISFVFFNISTIKATMLMVSSAEAMAFANQWKVRNFGRLHISDDYGLLLVFQAKLVAAAIWLLIWPLFSVSRWKVNQLQWYKEFDLAEKRALDSRWECWSDIRNLIFCHWHAKND